MEVVTLIITPIVESLLVPVKRHLAFLVSSSKHVRNTRTKVTELYDTARDMHSKQVSNKANSLAVPHHVPKWLEEVDTIKARAESIPTGGVECFNIRMRYKAGKQSSHILKVIDRLMREKSEMVWTDENIPLAMINTMSIVAFPSYHITHNFQHLRRIYLYRTQRVEVVFEIESTSNRELRTQQQKQPLLLLTNLEELELWYLHTLTHVWKCNNWNKYIILHKHQPQSSFQNLTIIELYYCKSIKYMFSPLMAKLLSNIKKITIEYCKVMEEVVSNRDDDDNEMMTSTSPHTTTNLFPHLDLLELSRMDNLRSFLKRVLFLGPYFDDGEYIFTFSTLDSLKNLETLKIRNCKAMKVIVREEYGEQTMASSNNIDVVFPHLKSIELDSLPNLAGFFLGMNIDFHWPLLDYVMIDDCPQMMAFTSGRSITPRLKYIHTMLGKHTLECSLNFQGTPQQLQKLETIHSNRCFNVEKVFEVALEVTNNELQTVVKFPKLKLKYIWKSNHQRILEFPNLTTLSINECRSLEHVFTYSMVSCVMQLQELHIQRCKNIKEEEEEDCDVKVSEIKFPCLKSLKLYGLASLEGFSLGMGDLTMPSLVTVEIVECQRIKVFTEGRPIAPKLKVVETSFGSFNVGDDINYFIMSKKQEGYKFGELDSSSSEDE
ncbi:hypothetical protein L1987_65132 [Smallanthus sonchifolius]|uniref:Uncharacterized protein n=1 Tax=Smallanthus sonchifolius TaxID=185202 RepID=A0ACB9BTH8_9ASTR|nr:hypothetical protein L1987_65132 [Smallanthus sonchifolius]